MRLHGIKQPDKACAVYNLRTEAVLASNCMYRNCKDARGRLLPVPQQRKIVEKLCRRFNGLTAQRKSNVKEHSSEAEHVNNL